MRVFEGQLGLLHPQVADHQPRLDVADHKVDVLRVCALHVVQHMAFRDELERGRVQRRTHKNSNIVIMGGKVWC